MFLCDECLSNPGIVYIEGVIICEICFTDLFGVSFDDVKKAASAFCPACESKVSGNHRCTAASIDAQQLINNIKVKGD